MVYIHPDGIRAFQVGKKLLKTASTPEEIAAAKAFRRVKWGTVILLLFFITALFIAIAWGISGETLLDNRRTGTVQEDGTVRYIHNDAKYISLEALGLGEAGLQKGDEVILGFDHQDNLTAAVPKTVQDEKTNLRIGVIVGVMILMAVVLLVYALVICRYTSFGSAWYRYIRRQKKKEDKELPLKTRIVIYAIAAVIALLICTPQIVQVVENVQRMQRIEQFGNLMDSVEDAAQQASDISEKLDNIKPQTDALEDAAESGDKIWEILDDINKDEEGQ